MKKAYDAGRGTVDVFSQEDAVVRLGVGKNMVKSIRFWGLAFGILAETTGGGRGTHVNSTKFGRALLSDDGWDPYCELPGTLWLLHWSLINPRSMVPVWWLAFNEFSAVEFTAEELEQFVSERTREWSAPHETAVKKDVLCMLRMYASGHSKRASFEDAIDCPFRELNLLRASATTPGAYRFLIGPKPTLPPAIAAFACLDFIARTDSGSRLVTVNQLASQHGSPGQAFQLTEAELVELLRRASAESVEIDLTSAAGVVQLAFDDEPSAVATEILRDHYRRLIGSANYFGVQWVGGPSADEVAEDELVEVGS